MDDRWRDNYDAWKLRSPDDELSSNEECDHFEYEVDGFGRAFCCECGASWYLSAAELQSYDDAVARREEEHDRMQRRENRLWRRLFRWLKKKFTKRPPVVDDIPF